MTRARGAEIWIKRTTAIDIFTTTTICDCFQGVQGVAGSSRSYRTIVFKEFKELQGGARSYKTIVFKEFKELQGVQGVTGR
jgi:hypothetical protein